MRRSAGLEADAVLFDLDGTLVDSVSETSVFPGIAAALAALAARRPPRARAVMVGNRMHDVHGAAAHGLACIGVLWGIGSRTELTGAGAAALVGSPAELETLL